MEFEIVIIALNTMRSSVGCFCNYIRKNEKISKIILFILIFFAMLFINTNLYAKYIITKDFSITSNSLPFYITQEVSDTNIVINDEVGSLTLKIKNNDGTNNNNFNTNYQILIDRSDLYNISLTDTNNGVLQGGSLKENVVEVKFTAINGAQIKLNETVNLIVKTTAPYSKEINCQLNLNKPDSELIFGGLSDFRKIELSDCVDYTTYNGTYDLLYSGNNEKLEYDANGNLVFDGDNPILVLDLDPSATTFQDEYSLYCTIKADVTQGVKYGSTILSIGDGSGKYIGWLSIFQGYLHIYSYVLDNAGTDFARPTIQKGFGSYDITKYQNQIMNIQVTSSRLGYTNVYINGEKLTRFESGGVQMPASHATIGDLRPLRNLKFVGTIYDFSMYNSELTEEQVKNNWNYAKNKWFDN